MAIVKKILKSLTGGVSEQPDSQRFDNQSTEQKNFLSDAVKGLVKRPGCDWVSQIIPTSYDAGPWENLEDFQSHIKTHVIKRSGEEELLFVVSNNQLGLYNALTGAELNLWHDPDQTNAISMSGPYNDGYGSGYLTYPYPDYPNTPFEMVTVADYTFVINKGVTVAKRADVADYGNEDNGFIIITEGQYKTTYEVKLKDTSGNYREVIVTTGSESSAYDYYTSQILGAMHWGIDGNSGTFTLASAAGYASRNTTITVSFSDTGSFTEDDFFIDKSKQESVLLFHTHSSPSGSGALEVSTTDTWGQSLIVSGYNTTEKFENLPLKCWNDFHLKIRGNPTAKLDDYYVKFQTDDTTLGITDQGTGQWVESVGRGEELRFDKETMPHVLVRIDATNYWFGPLDDGNPTDDLDDGREKWSEKGAGDSVTNPFPSFVGQKLNDLAFFKSRLGFLSGENLTLSETDDPFDYFRSSVTQIVPTDRIDITTSVSELTELNHAVPFANQLILFSDRAQFIVTSGAGGLTPSTASLALISSFDCSPTAKPHALDYSIVFSRAKGSASDIMELYPTGSAADSFDARNITSHVPSYIKGSVIAIRTSSLSSCIVVQTDEDITQEDYSDGPKLYIYKYFNEGDERVQSSWSKYMFNHYVDFILGFHFVGKDLRIISECVVENTTPGSTDGTEKYFYDSIRFDNTDTIAHSLDQTVDQTETVRTGASGGHTLGYDSGADFTLIKLPYEIPTPDIYTAVIVDDSGVTGTVESAPLNNDTGKDIIKVTGDWSAKIFTYGNSFISEYEFSKIYLKKANHMGVEQSILDGRTTVKFFECYFNNSQFMKLEVTYPDMNRDSTSKTFTGTVVGGAVLGDQSSETGTLRIMVGARNDVPVIKLTSSTHQTATVTGAAADLTYNNRMKNK